MTRAHYRWQAAREAVRLLNEVFDALARAQAKEKATAAQDEFAPVALEPSAVVPPPSTTTVAAWERAAHAAELTPGECAEGRAWVERRRPVGRGAVLEEVMPDAVRKALATGFFDLPPLAQVDDLLPDPPDPPDEPDDAQFWDDIGRASDPPDAPEVRRAMDRLAKLVRLKPEDARALAAHRRLTMQDAKRWLVQTAVLYTLGAAEEPARTDRQRAAADAAHPLTLEDVFGADGLAEMLGQLTHAAITAGEPVLIDEQYKAALRETLGGPFHPDHLLDRAILRRWVVTEIRRRVDVLVREDVQPEGVRETRRAEIEYDDENELSRLTTLSIRPPAYVPPGARAPRDGPFRADTLSEVKAIERKRRMEDVLLARVDASRWIDDIRPSFTNSPRVLAYLDAVQAEPALAGDAHAAARALGWSLKQVENARERVKRAKTRHAAHRRFEALFL